MYICVDFDGASKCPLSQHTNTLNRFPPCFRNKSKAIHQPTVEWELKYKTLPSVPSAMLTIILPILFYPSFTPSVMAL